MDIQKWFRRADEYMLTIQDILNLEKGDVIDLYIFDKNIWEFTHKINNSHTKTYSPQYYFRNNTAVYIHDKNLDGTLLFSFPFPIRDEIFRDFTFSVKPPNSDWSIIDYYGYCFSNYYNSKVHWTTLPKNTKVGWRGPVMNRNNMKYLPKIIHTKKMNI